jgi:hypothetical protein
MVSGLDWAVDLDCSKHKGTVSNSSIRRIGNKFCLQMQNCYVIKLTAIIVG